MKKVLCILSALLLLAGVACAEADWMDKWNEVVELKCNPPKYLVKMDYRWSLADADGIILEEDMLHELGEFADGIAVVRTVSGYGYLKEDGTFLVEPVLAFAGNFYNGRARVEAAGMKGFIDLTGEFVVQPKYDYANDFFGGYASVGVKGAETIGLSSETGYEQLWGLIDLDGNVVVPLEYDSVGYDPEMGSALAQKGDRVESFSLPALAKDGEAAVDDSWKQKWEEIVPLKCEPVRYLAWAKGEYEWSLLDANGKMLREDMLDMFHGFEDGIAVVRRGAGYGYLKEDGTFLIEPVLDWADGFRDGLANVETDGKKGYINREGAYVIEPIYDYANNFYGGYAEVALRGTELVEDECSGMSYELFWGMIDTQGNVVVPLEYSYIEYDPDDNTVEAEKDGQDYLFTIVDGALMEVAQVRSGLRLEDYMPNAGGKVAILDEPAAIEWDASAPKPRMDGATALFPIYSAFGQAAYGDVLRYGGEEFDPLITCTKTIRAYERLAEGSADVIFCAEPSAAQLEMAAAAGVEFELTPFGREAFVFIVQNENPLDSITVEQIQKVYSGQIADWAELGIDGLGGIIAYQRPENSGSQTALEALMGNIPLMEAPGKWVADGMGDILEQVEYRNLPNALGYSFRFYCTEMEGSHVKLLAIDGVEPTMENIRDGSYPITSILYAVTRKGENNPNVQILLDWVQGPQGQALVEKSGYVGW